MRVCLLLVACCLSVNQTVAAQELSRPFPTVISTPTLDQTPASAVLSTAAVAVPDRMRDYPDTHWREGAVIGGALTAVLLWHSGWIELPGALILVPLGAVVGALVGGQFPR